MGIEIGKITAATQRLQEKLESYNTLELDHQSKQSVADEARKAADIAKASALVAVADLQAILTEIQQRNTPGDPLAPVAEILTT